MCKILIAAYIFCSCNERAVRGTFVTLRRANCTRICMFYPSTWYDLRYVYWNISLCLTRFAVHNTWHSFIRHSNVTSYRYDVIVKQQLQDIRSISFRSLRNTRAGPYSFISTKLLNSSLILFSATQQPKSGQGRFIFLFLGLTQLDINTHTHTQTLGLLWTKIQLVAEAATCTTHKKHKHPCPQRVSNPRSQQSSGRRPTYLTARPTVLATA
jgi:hypothetical protein